ncbi:hypothetical protein D3C72_1628680 [compost metagenome]
MDMPAMSGMMPESLRCRLASSVAMPSGRPSCRAQTDKSRNNADTSRQGMVHSRPSRMARRALALARAASRSFGYSGKIDFGMAVAFPVDLSDDAPSPGGVKIRCRILAPVFIL